MNSRFKFYYNELTSTIFVVHRDLLVVTIQFAPESKFAVLLTNLDSESETKKVIADCEETTHTKMKTVFKNSDFLQFFSDKFDMLKELLNDLDLPNPLDSGSSKLLSALGSKGSSGKGTASGAGGINSASTQQLQNKTASTMAQLQKSAIEQMQERVRKQSEKN